jgi:4-amino-4-deoxy-L-arabinose transferase-like glycosyltransferase
MLVAALVRLWDLEHIPFGMFIDEGDRAMQARYLNRGEPLVFNPFNFFSTDWWGVPTAYFWLLGQSLKVFGDTLAGARTVHALAGIATVWFTYRVGRVAWSPRVGLIAAALLAVSDFAIHFSRTAGESTITLFAWTACFYFLYKALKLRRPADFVLGGLALGLALYGYASGKLLPLFMIPIGLYLVIRWGARGMKAYLPGLLLMALTAALTYGPNGLFVLDHPHEFNARLANVSIFEPAARPGYFGSDSPFADPIRSAQALSHQFELTYRALDVGHEAGPFYPTGQPILWVPWAALFLLGTAYLVWRMGDVRFAVLGLWLLSGLAGAAFTNDTPTLQRVAGMVPTLALIPAVFVDRVATGFGPLARGSSAAGSRRPVVGRRFATAICCLLIAVLAAQSLYTYFVTYGHIVAYQRYGLGGGPQRYVQSVDFELVGRYAQSLDPSRDVIYLTETPEIYWQMGPTRFLVDRVPVHPVNHPADQPPQLPAITNEGKNVHFIIFPSYDSLRPALMQLYPGGTELQIKRPDGSLFFTVFRIDKSELQP